MFTSVSTGYLLYFKNEDVLKTALKWINSISFHLSLPVNQVYLKNIGKYFKKAELIWSSLGYQMICQQVEFFFLIYFNTKYSFYV